MHDKLLIRRTAWCLVVLALLAAMPVLWNRFTRENANRRVELMLDLPSARTLAQQEGYPLVQFLTELRKIGVTAVAVYEQDLTALHDSGLAVVRSGSDLRVAVAESANPHPFLLRLVRENRIDAQATYLLPRDHSVAATLLSSLRARLGEHRVVMIPPVDGEPGAGVLEIDAPLSVLKSYGVGFDPADFELAHAADLKVVPRPRPAPAATPELIRDVFDEMQRLAPEMNSVLFWGGQVLGYRSDDPDGVALKATAAEMKQRGLIQIMVEHYTQLGLLDQKGQMEIPPVTGYRVARLYSMEQVEVDKYRPELAVEKWGRAVLERNIRALYLRPFTLMRDPGLTQIETNYKYFRLLVSDLHRMGFPPGGPDVYENYQVPWWQKGLVGVGVVGAGVLWLSLIIPFRPRTLLVLAAVGTPGVVLLPLVLPGFGSDMIALAGAILFPTLAGTLLLKRWGASARADLRSSGGASAGIPATGARSLFQEGLAVFTIFAGVSVLGGLVVAAVLGDIRHMLEFEYFRGVKLTLAAPLAGVVLAYFLMDREGRPAEIVRGLVQECWSLLGMTVRYRHVVLGLAGAVAVFWYLQRSGNFPVVPVPQWELRMRALLEQLLVARPRTKEFAVAYPALGAAVAAAWYGWRSWILPFLLAALTGASGGLVNSFEHLRTPWAISLLRGFNGFWLGALVAMVAITVLVRGVRWVEGALADEKRKGPET